MAFYRSTIGTYTTNVDLTRQVSPVSVPIVPSATTLSTLSVDANVAQISAADVAVQQTGAVAVVSEDTYKVEGTSETFGIVGEIFRSSTSDSQPVSEPARETASVFSEDTNIAYLPIGERIEQITGIDINAQMIKIPEGKFTVPDAVRDLLDKRFSPFQSALMAAHEQRQAIENALKGTLFIALKSDFSGELEANTLQVPAISNEFVYNFYEITEEDIVLQEDTSKDPLFDRSLGKVPLFAKLTWEPVNVINTIEIQDSITNEEQKTVSEATSQPKESATGQIAGSAFNLAANAKIFGSSVSVSLQNQNTQNTSFTSNLFGMLFKI